MARSHQATYDFTSGADEVMQSKIFAINDPMVKRALKDFRVENRVARIKGEGKFKSVAFPEFESKNVLLEFISRDEWKKNLPSFLVRWCIALRIPYLLFSLLPILLVAASYFQMNRSIQGSTMALLLSSIIFLHLGCNLWSDYEDHLRGIDSPDHEGGSGVIQKLWIPAVHLRNMAALLFGAGLLLGIFLFLQIPYEPTGKKILWIGLSSALAIASFSGWPFHYKYFGLGEPIMFLLAGPVVTIGASFVFFQDSNYWIWFALLSLPLSFLATLRLHAGNLQRIPFDKMANSITIAKVLGFQKSKLAFGFLFIAPFLCVLFSAFYMGAPKASLATFLLLPLLYFPFKNLAQASGPLDPACQRLRRDAAKFHLLFGLVYCISFLFA